MATGSEGLTRRVDDPFFVGTAISTFQNSGDPNCNWGAFEQQGRKFCYLLPTITDGQHVGVSSDFWNNYEQHIELAAQLGTAMCGYTWMPQGYTLAGSNAFRFSLEWSRVMPTPSDICRDAVARFHDILDCCKRWVYLQTNTGVHTSIPQAQARTICDAVPLLPSAMV